VRLSCNNKIQVEFILIYLFESFRSLYVSVSITEVAEVPTSSSSASPVSHTSSRTWYGLKGKACTVGRLRLNARLRAPLVPPARALVDPPSGARVAPSGPSLTDSCVLLDLHYPQLAEVSGK